MSGLASSNRVREADGRVRESVWDYPRPPALEPTDRRIQVIFDDLVVADTRRAFRVLETSHPPTYYLPPDDVRTDLLDPAPGTTMCEWKGRACYWSLSVGQRTAYRAVWGYPSPTEPFRDIRGHLAFYPHLVDRCLVDGEVVGFQDGGFYGGWITSDLVGPFKGGARRGR